MMELNHLIVSSAHLLLDKEKQRLTNFQFVIALKGKLQHQRLCFHEFYGCTYLLIIFTNIYLFVVIVYLLLFCQYNIWSFELFIVLLLCFFHSNFAPLILFRGLIWTSFNVWTPN